MFNKTKVVDGLVGIVGFEQPYNPAYAILDAANLTSRSGYFVNEIEMAKVSYFKDSQEYQEITDVDFNTLLQGKQKSAIASVCNLVFNKPDFQDRNVLYTRANNNVDAESLVDGFVGFRLNVKKEKNFAFKITRVILDFQGNTPNNIKLQLYNTGDPEPIQEKDITISEQHQVESLDWVVDNSGDTYKGDYYLGYVKSATTPVPFKRDYNDSSVMSNIEGLEITPVQFVGHSTDTLFNLDDEDGLSENIGVNPDMMVYDDYTDFILQNELLFGRAVQLQMAISMLTTTTSSSRVNRNQRISDGDVLRMLQTINGIDSDGKLKIVGLIEQLSGEITSIGLEVDKLRKGYFGGPIMVTTLT